MNRPAGTPAWAGALGAVALLAACAAPGEGALPAAAPPRSDPPAAAHAALRNPGFEEGMRADGRCAIGWDCTMHNNPEAFRFTLLEEGAARARSLCIERVADEPWALATQAFQKPALRGKRLRLSMRVRVESAVGEGAGPWVLAQGNPPVNARRLARGTRPWERVDVELAVPADASVVEVGATLEGPGKACFDDVRLEIL